MSKESDLKFHIILHRLPGADGSANLTMRRVRIRMKNQFRRMVLRGLHAKAFLVFDHVGNDKGHGHNLIFIHDAYVRCEENKELAVRCYYALFHALQNYFAAWILNQPRSYEDLLYAEMQKRQVHLDFEDGETLIPTAEADLQKMLAAVAGKFQVVLESRNEKSSRPYAPVQPGSSEAPNPQTKTKTVRKAQRRLPVDDRSHQPTTFLVQLLAVAADSGTPCTFLFKNKELNLFLTPESLQKVQKNISKYEEKPFYVRGVPVEMSQVTLLESSHGAHRNQKRGRRQSGHAKGTAKRIRRGK